MQTYHQLISDLEAKGIEVVYTTLEIGSSLKPFNLFDPQKALLLIL